MRVTIGKAVTRAWCWEKHQAGQHVPPMNRTQHARCGEVQGGLQGAGNQRGAGVAIRESGDRVASFTRQAVA